MARHSFTVQQVIHKPMSEVYDKLADHNTMGKWLSADIKRVKDSPDKKAGPNGVGSVRTIRMFFLVEFDETVILADKPRRIEYRITRGSPLKNHLGEIALTQMGDDTEITWTVSFEPVIPMTGWLITFLVSSGIKQGLAKLKKMLETT
jgi:uncharacterized membrane protein